MLILGIESSCDETAAAVCDGRRVLSSVVASQHELHAEYGGVVPEIASRAHVERLTPTLEAALRDAGASPADLGAIAVGARPGLIGALLVGVSAAKALAWALGARLIGVDHVEAHLYAPLLDTDATDDEVYPALGLVVSGGHTALYRLDGPLRLTRLGSTIDDAVGEAFDKAAVILGLGHPGGPALERLASGGDDSAHGFPVSRLGRESLDFSFSGLKTAVLYAVRGLPKRGGAFERDHTALTDAERADVAASFQRAAIDALTLKVGRALDGFPGCRSLLVGGGVSANARLTRELAALGAARGVGVRVPPMAWRLDNAAMIAGLAGERARAGSFDGFDLRARPTTGAGARSA